MKKSNLIKLFSILTISVMVMMFSTNVLAANDTFTELSVSNGNTENASSNTNNANANANANNTNTNTNRTNTNNTNNTNSSIYNNTNLPKTGIEDSIPVAMLVVVFGISAVYAYKKIKDYRNI